MAYAERHGRWWRCRWRDPEGALRSAAGFKSREAAVEYGREREQSRRGYSFTRAQLADALTRLDVRVLTAGPAAFKVNAESMADAIIEALGDG